MAHRAANGWISPFPDDYNFTVDISHGGKRVLRRPTGIFVHGSSRTGVAMNYAGFDDSGALTFDLPTDTARLRDIARAIEGIADDIDNDPYGTRRFSN